MQSVILATYEGERYIGAQLDSILAQLSESDEVIISDDASTARTVDIARQRNDPRIKIVLNSSRLGYVKNFERAIASARGEHIFFSDQDDIWLPEKVSMMQSALRRKACVFSDAIIVDQDLRQLYASYFEFRKAHAFSFAAVFFRPCLIGATMACRKDYLATLLPFPADVPHDFWIALNAILDGRLEIVRDPLILYRRHAATASISATTLKRSGITIIDERLRMAKHLLSRRIRRRAR